MNRAAALTAADVRDVAGRQMNEATQRLVATFAGVLPAETVLRIVGEAREDLLNVGLQHPGLATATEAMARTRLLTLASSR